MHFKSFIKGIALSFLFSSVKSEDCNFLRDKYKEISTCYSDDDSGPYFLEIRNSYNNTILKDVTKLTTLSEILIYNDLNVTADLSILKKLKKLTTFTYHGTLDDKVMKDISTLSKVNDLSIFSNNNVNFKPLKSLKLKKLYVNCCYQSEVDYSIVPNTLSSLAKTLKELTISSCLIDDKEDLSSLTKVTDVSAYGMIDSKLLKKIAAMKAVKTVFLYYQKLNKGIRDVYEIDVSDLVSAPKLTELDISTGLTKYRNRIRIKAGTLKGFRKIKTLYFHCIGLKQEVIDEISNMKTIETLEFNGCPLVSDLETNVEPTYDSLINLKRNLKYLYFAFPKKTTYDSDKFNEFPEFIYELTNLRNLTIHDTYIQSISEKIVNLKKLEHLDLSNNDLYTLPKNINDLNNLIYFDVNGNEYLKGKVLNNNKIEYCNYRKTSMCREDEDVKCLNEIYNSGLKYCNSECNEFFDYLIENKNFTDFTSNYCVNNNEGKAISVIIDDSEIDEESIDKLITYKDTITDINFHWSGNENTLSKIGEFTNTNELSIDFVLPGETLDLSPINNLNNLIKLDIKNEYNVNNCEIKEGSLDKLNNLEGLVLSSITLTQGLINDIGKLTNLRTLYIYRSGFPIDLDYSPLSNLVKVFNLDIEKLGAGETPLYEIPKPFYELTNLSTLIINDQKITTIDSEIANLKRLSNINFENNNIESLPLVLNTLERLTIVDFEGNPNLKGAVVDNDNLFSCNYDSNNSKLCKPKELNCIKNYSYKLCD